MPNKSLATKPLALYYLHHEAPLTANELSEVTTTSQGTVSSALTDLYQNGVLDRRQRSTSYGAPPYEYWISDGPQEDLSDGGSGVEPRSGMSDTDIRKRIMELKDQREAASSPIVRASKQERIDELNRVLAGGDGDE